MWKPNSQCFGWKIFFLTSLFWIVWQPFGMTESGSPESKDVSSETALPPLPVGNGKLVPVELFSVAEVASEPDKCSIQLVDSSNQLSIQKVPEKNAIWRVIKSVDGDNCTVARMAIRKGNLLFVWSRAHASQETRSDLQHSTLIVKDEKDNAVDRKLGRQKIIGSHHGYDRTQATPHQVAHEYDVPGLPERPRIKLKMQSPYAVKLMEKNEKQRTVTARKWLKVPFRFEEENLKRVKIGMHWMVERPRKSKKNANDDGNKIIVNQKITYDIGAYKDLPLSKQQIDQHLSMLQQKNRKENAKYKIHQRELGVLQGNAAAVAGAAPGTQAWAKQTQLHNQIKSKQRVMRSAEKRVRNRLKDMSQLNVFKDQRLEATLLQLNNQTYPYQVVMETDTGDEVLIESKTWGYTAEQCNLMLGRWVNDEKNWTMDVSEYQIVNNIDGSVVNQSPSRRDFISPCATESVRAQTYEGTKEFKMIAYFTEYSKKGARALLRREFTVSEASPNIAHEVFTSYTKNWVSRGNYQYISPSGAVFTKDIGQYKEAVETYNLTWRKIE